MENTLRIVGDIHGDTDYLREHILKDVEKSVQVGDYGIGFGSKTWHDKEIKWQRENPNHRFIRGNHDDPDYCEKMPNFNPDGWWNHLKNGNIMHIGGAWSIDYAVRREGKSWWPNEECSTEKFEKLYTQYCTLKPEVMITHDAPHSIPKYMKLFEGTHILTRTGLWLERMFVYHRPKYWFFGHWHQTKQYALEGTNFMCLAINEWVDFDLDRLEIVDETSKI